MSFVARPIFLYSAISRIVSTDSFLAGSMKLQVFTTRTSAWSGCGVSSWPLAASWPIMTSLSTRFLGQPKLTKPTFKVCIPDLPWSASFRITLRFMPRRNAGLLRRTGAPAPRRKMPIPFIGKSAALSARGLAAVAAALGVASSEIWTVIAVETSGCGFLADRRPQILYERHIFHRLTGGRFDDGDI